MINIHARETDQYQANDRILIGIAVESKNKDSKGNNLREYNEINGEFFAKVRYTPVDEVA